MIIEESNEIFNMVYIAKKLHDLGEHELVSKYFSDVLDYDMYYDVMSNLMFDLYEYHLCDFYENRNLEIHIISDKVIENFYRLAGEYGVHLSLSDEDNPYIIEAKSVVENLLNFHFSLDHILMGYTKPKRPFHSRIGLFISYDDYVDIGVLVFRLLQIYEWFEGSCSRLSAILNADKSRDEVKTMEVR